MDHMMEQCARAKRGVFSIDDKDHRAQRDAENAAQAEIEGIYRQVGLDRSVSLEQIVASMESGLTSGVWAHSQAEFARRRDELDRQVRERAASIELALRRASIAKEVSKMSDDELLSELLCDDIAEAAASLASIAKEVSEPPAIGFAELFDDKLFAEMDAALADILGDDKPPSEGDDKPPAEGDDKPPAEGDAQEKHA